MFTMSLREDRSRANRSTSTWADSQIPVAMTPSLLLVLTYNVPVGHSHTSWTGGEVVRCGAVAARWCDAVWSRGVEG